MTPRRRAALIVGLILILIGIIIFAVLLLRSAVPQAPPTAFEEEEETETTVEPPPEEDFINPLVIAEPPTPGGTAARQVAELFAERYGSYSNQGDYQNLRDLLPVMTPRYRDETETFLASTPAQPSGQQYEGVTSVKISTEVRSIDVDSAVIAVSLQQEKASGTSAPTVGYRTLRMEIILIGQSWLVDDASWEG